MAGDFDNGRSQATDHDVLIALRQIVVQQGREIEAVKQQQERDIEKIQQGNEARDTKLAKLDLYKAQLIAWCAGVVAAVQIIVKYFWPK
jgi:multidrug resistance efflux pump